MEVRFLAFGYVSNPVHPYVNVGLERISAVFFWGRDEEVEACSISGATVEKGADS